MYDNETYSGAGAGLDTSAAGDGKDRETAVMANEENGGVGMNEDRITGSNEKNRDNISELNSGAASSAVRNDEERANEFAGGEKRSAGVFSGAQNGVYGSGVQSSVNGNGMQNGTYGNGLQNNVNGSAAQSGTYASGAQNNAGGSAVQSGAYGNMAQSSVNGSAANNGTYASGVQSNASGSAAQSGTYGNGLQDNVNGSAANNGTYASGAQNNASGTSAQSNMYGSGIHSGVNSSADGKSGVYSGYGAAGSAYNSNVNNSSSVYSNGTNDSFSAYNNSTNNGSGAYNNGANNGSGAYNNSANNGSGAYNNSTNNGSGAYNSNTNNSYGTSANGGFYQSNGNGSDRKGNENNFYNEYETSPVLKQESDKKKKEGKEKKKGGFFRKAVLAVSLGLFFGLFAGIGFVAVQQASALTTRGGGNEAALSGNVEGPVDTNSGTDETKSGIKLTDTSSIRVVSSDVSDVVEEVMPAMVSIVNNFTQTGMTIFGQTYSQDAAASGTGIIVAESEKELLIVTNHHVVADATKLEVSFIDGSVAEAQIKGTDSDMDLAVIAIPLESLTEDTKAAIAIATLGDSDTLKMGEPVIAIGNALGYGQSVTNGIVSALDRAITLEDGSTGTFIQTNAAINPGNSGGALLNVNGEVIGINSNKIGGSVVEGMGYAIPISAAKPIIADLMLKETRTKVEDGQVGYMGITLQSISEQFSEMYKMPQGVYVTGVEDGSPAKEAGILSGDIIVNFDGEKIQSYEDLQNVLQYYGAGSTAKLVVKRPQNGEYQSVELEITLGSKPASQQ